MSSFMTPSMATTADTRVIDVNKPPAATAMEAKDLALGFGSATVLSDINVAIPKGAITALIGPTGSGKTTFLRSLNRMNDRVAKHWHKGEVLLELLRPLQSVDVTEGRPILVQRDNLIGWTGAKMSARALPPSEAPSGQRGLLSLAGDGTIFLAVG